MFGNNSLWIHAKRGYLPEQATSRPPRGDVFVDGAPLPSESSQAGSGPGIKTGAGGKPQGYDSHGRYTGPRGGAVSLRDGSIRLFADGPQEPDGAGGAWGQPGTDNEDWRLKEKQYSPDKLVKNALAEVGSGKWYPQTEDGETKNQCNIFVADKLRESGARVPNVGGYSGMAGPEASDWLHETTGGRMGGHAPSASDWHRGKVSGFEQVHGAPQKGDVAASMEHVGIVSRPGKTVSVTTIGPNAGRVVENDWGFRDNQKTITFWRHNGSTSYR